MCSPRGFSLCDLTVVVRTSRRSNSLTMHWKVLRLMIKVHGMNMRSRTGVLSESPVVTVQNPCVQTIYFTKIFYVTHRTQVLKTLLQCHAAWFGHRNNEGPTFLPIPPRVVMVYAVGAKSKTEGYRPANYFCRTEKEHVAQGYSWTAQLLRASRGGLQPRSRALDVAEVWNSWLPWLMEIRRCTTGRTMLFCGGIFVRTGAVDISLAFKKHVEVAMTLNPRDLESASH